MSSGVPHQRRGQQHSAKNGEKRTTTDINTISPDSAPTGAPPATLEKPAPFPPAPSRIDSSPNYFLPLTFLLLVRLLGARFAVINDCDEVYNFYEPLHYLLHGTGFKTWEYSDEFALRSWLYLGLYYWPCRFLGAVLQVFPGVFGGATYAKGFSVISRCVGVN